MHSLKPLPQFLSELNITKINPITGDGGHRKYYRVSDKNSTYILMQDPYIKEYKHNTLHNFAFINVHTVLQNNNISVPLLIKAFPQEGCLLLEDLGDINLYQTKNKNTPLYQASLDELIKIQNIHIDLALPIFQKSFNSNFLIKELKDSLMSINNFLLKKNQLTILPSTLVKEITTFCKSLEKSSLRLVHRDFHSRNIMIKNTQIKIIDFQDARLGHPLYDLASLLEDPYTKLESQKKEQLKQYFIQKSQIKLANFDHHYYSISIHRLLKAAASFIKLAKTNNNTVHNYLIDLPYAIKQSYVYIKKIAYPEMQKFIFILSEVK